MSKLTDTAFSAFIEQCKAKIKAVMPISKEKAINYGYQLVMEQHSSKLTLNIYNGKKGLNLVYAGDSLLEARVRSLLGEKTAALQDAAPEAVAAPEKAISPEAAAPVPAGKWAGSDESGKGDFFGSLVVAAVVVDSTTAAKLQAAGVKDCKLLSDKKILELESVIKENVVDYSVLELKPRVYNLRYEQVAAEGGKLNQLLGYGHVAALTQVLQRQPDCHSALIDQFTTSTVNIRALKERFPKCQVRQQPKAESNLAVAAASVLARACFLRTMEALAQQAGLPALPKGGGAAATDCARKMAKNIGKAGLRAYVKLHFANYQRV